MDKNNMFIINLRDVHQCHAGLVGGKAANLGELFNIEGVNVPDGFCITTALYKSLVSHHQIINALLSSLSQQNIEDLNNIRTLCSSLRNEIEELNLPETLTDEIAHFVSRKGIHESYAVRSSATAEDLPMASFAGQQDSYLNVVGAASILQHIKKCWASLFTERAVIYRMQNDIPHHEVGIAVVVQQMVFAEISGVLFTADPVTSNRNIVSINAGFGLGEALVAGKVNPDQYAICEGKISEKKIATKTSALNADPAGSNSYAAIQIEKQFNPALSDTQIIQLAALGKRIEAHFGAPQDIEWCMADDNFYFVQSRPITTLFPIPAPIENVYGTLERNKASESKDKRVYISVGHNQMMTDAMKPLGLSFFLMVTNAPMFVAAGRLFVDVTSQLASPDRNNKLIETFRNADPLIADALLTVSTRKDIFPESHQEQHSVLSSPQPDIFQASIKNEPAIVEELINGIQHSNQLLADVISSKSELGLLDFIKDDMQELKRIVFNPESMAVIMTAINASFWLNAKMKEWLDETSAADIISQSVENNISAEMGLALLDLADKIRVYPGVIQYLESITDELNPEALTQIKGGQETMNAITSYLDKFGMRCVGEIDITRTRLAEKPAMLVPLILSHIKNFEANERVRRFAIGLRNAEQKENDLFERLKQLTDGEEKANETRRVISYIRNFIGFREYPKYGKICRYFHYRKALLNEASELLKAGVIKQVDDIYYLSFEELYDVIRSKYLDDAIISRRKAEYKFFGKLIPPRVITSDGEIIVGRYVDKNLPEGALRGLAVSSGIVEGRARIIMSIEGAELEKGDILVTRFTDPSWTPFFVTVKGLVTEVGGLMTHGAVVAREYGLPAVVGVENATRLIRDGQRIRVNGTEGYVEVLNDV